MPLLFGESIIMLRKDICVKCKNKNCADSEGTIGIIRRAWNEIDEANWKAGEVYCPYDYFETGEKQDTQITGKPPSKCPYFLEHVI